MPGAREEAILGCLLGTAVGDAIGLCCEGLSPRRQGRLFPQVGHHVLFGKGMVSDDTEHACMVAQALIASGGEGEPFAADLARRLRRWLLGVPVATGYATLRAALKLGLGFSYRRSGVFSAGNGPAMRSPLLGVCWGHDPGRLRELVQLSTRMTHTDPKAEYGAFAVAWAAHLACREAGQPASPGEYHESLSRLLDPGAEELLDLIGQAVRSAAGDEPTASFVAACGMAQGVSGYMYHSVPAVLHAWFRHPADYRGAIVEIVRCGGDTDSTAATLGGLVGCRVGKAGIPPEWLGGLWEWPRTVSWMEQLGKELAEVTGRGLAKRPPALPAYGVLLRNLFFLVVVLGHGFRRLLPPY